MSVKEMVLQLVEQVPEEKMYYVLGLLQGLVANEAMISEKPNETTLSAMQAAENDDDMYGPYDSVEELMEALNA